MLKECNKCKLIKDLSKFYKRGDNTGLRSECRECSKSIAKIYTAKNRKKINQQQIKRYRKNPKPILKSIQKYQRKRFANDINFRINCRLRSRLANAIRRGQKAGSAVRDLGCSVAELKLYLESKFKSGMTWDNWGIHGWHIDHIVPLKKFDLTNREQFKKAVHHSNLQPLWAQENLDKRFID